MGKSRWMNKLKYEENQRKRYNQVRRKVLTNNKFNESPKQKQRAARLAGFRRAPLGWKPLEKYCQVREKTILQAIIY